MLSFFSGICINTFKYGYPLDSLFWFELSMPQTNRSTYAINPTNKLHNKLISTTYQKNKI